MFRKNQARHFIRFLCVSLTAMAWLTACTPNSLTPLEKSPPEETVSLSLHSPEPRSTSKSVIPIYASFSEELVDLSIKSFKITNGSLLSFQQMSSSPQTYFLEVVPSNIGTIVVSFTAEQVWAKATNALKSTQKKQLTFDFVYVGPATRFSAPSKPFINSEASTEYILTYYGTYTAMSPNFADYLSLFYSDGNAQCGPVVLDQISNFQFSVKISNCTGNGLVRLRVGAGSASADDGPFPMMTALYEVKVDNTAPAFSIQPPVLNTGDASTVFSWRLTLTDSTLDLSTLTTEHFQWSGDISNCDVTLSSGTTQRDLVVSNCLGSSEIQFTIPRGTIKDPAGNLSEEVISTSVTFANVPI